MKIKAPARDDVAVDMGPMIDLVFLLLIFFMVASVVTELDKKEVDIPLSKHAKVPDDTTGRMMLSVDANNDIYVGLTPVDIDQLKVEVERELERNPELRILIRADHRVEYKTCKEIMIACGEVGATDLIYATFEE
jgi:biopolymer transport protein ExbD